MSASLDKSETPEPKAQPKPYLKPNGDLVIQFNSDPKFHWWKGGQKVNKTIEQLRAEAG
jgi:hypothetical protein